MSRKRTPVRSTGPVKGMSGSATKNIKPAWSKMLEPQDTNDLKFNNKSSFAAYNDYSDDSDEDEGDGLYHKGFTQNIGDDRNKQGFSLRDTMSNLNVSSRSKQSVNDFFDNTQQQMLQKPTSKYTRNPQHVSNSQQHQRPHKKRHQNIGPFEPNIPPDLEKHIISGEYIDFAEIVMLLGYQKTVEDAFALMAKDILVWLDCFMYYTSIVGSVAPGRIAGLMRYSRIIMWIYKESQDVTSWWRYDKAYRRLAALKRK